ncbi:hypothetical protein F2Q69_00015614, partial [Brassica cretica]
GLSLAATAPPPNNGQSESSLQIIDRSVFEEAGKKLPTTTKASVSSSWVHSICLGEGAHGVVYLVIRNDYVLGDAFPLKIAIKSAHVSSSFSLCDEERILKDLSSPHVISYYGSNITPAETRPLGSDYNLILEYCSGWSIEDFIKFRGTRMVESDVQLFAIQILKGINYKKGKRKLPAEKLSKLETRKEKKAKKDPYKPKRAPTAFFVFLEDFRKTFKKEIQIVVSAVGKAGGQKWKSMSRVTFVFDIVMERLAF